MVWEAGSERGLGGVKAVRQDERRIKQPAPYLIKRADRHELEVAEDTERRQDAGLGLKRIVPVRGFVQRGFDRQRSVPVRRCRPPNSALRSKISTRCPARA